MTKRRNGESSIFPYRNGYAAYAWVTTPAGERKRKWVYGKTHEEVHGKWVKLQTRAAEAALPTSVPAVSQYLAYWLREIVEPNLAPKTYETRKMFCRLHIIPHLGNKRLDRLQVKDIRQWLNNLGRICQCCAQGKDAKRPEEKRRCCAIGQCCHHVLSAESRKDARNVLRAALTCAVEDELITRNPAAVIRLSNRREPKSKSHSWSVDEARQFLESARHEADTFYSAYVLVLVLGLRRGELLGLTWELADLDHAQLYIQEQVQRANGQLIRHRTKTEASEAPLPLPDVCVAALKLRREQQDTDREKAGDAWIETGLVFTTRHGTPIEPRNFNRSFSRRIDRSEVPRLKLHGTRKTGPAVRCSRLSTCTHGRHADPAAQPDLGDHGDLHVDPVGRHPRSTPEARAVARQLARVAVLRCCTDITKGRFPSSDRPLTCGGA